MEQFASYISTAIAVVAFLAAVINYAVIKPLKETDKHNQERWTEAKKQLEQQAQQHKSQLMAYINEIRTNTNELVAQNAIMRERMSADEMNTKNGLERLAKLETRVNNLLENCRNCNNRKV